MIRDVTATTFVVWGEYTLLHRHPKLDLILPPGGHLEDNETPDEAAVREVREETGIDVALLSAGDAWPPASVAALTAPLGVLLEDIAPGHQHVDLLYIGVPEGDGATGAECSEVETSAQKAPVPAEGFRWYHLTELVEGILPSSVCYYGRMAVRQVLGRSAGRTAYVSERE